MAARDRTRKRRGNAWTRLPIATKLLAVTGALTALGLLAVYTAGSAYSELHHNGDPTWLVTMQGKRALIGIAFMLLCMILPYRIWKLFALPGVVLAAALLVLVTLHSPLAHTANGATRWLKFGSIQFQPSEFARYALVLFIAWWAWKKGRLMREFTGGVVPVLAVAGVFAALTFFQPDFSTAAMLLLTTLVLLHVVGIRPLHFAALSLLGAGAGVITVLKSDYMRQRVLAVIDPAGDPTGAGYQLLQSFISLGRGGLIGAGPGGSKQKLFFLPEAHTDFIYAIIGEEFGFLGTFAVLALFIVLVYLGLRVAHRSPEPFGAFLAAGITLTVGLYAFANMLVTVGLLPPTGLPLPLISYGGTSLIITLAALGVLINIARATESHAPRRPSPAAGRAGA